MNSDCEYCGENHKREHEILVMLEQDQRTLLELLIDAMAEAEALGVDCANIPIPDEDSENAEFVCDYLNDLEALINEAGFLCGTNEQHMWYIVRPIA